MKGVYGDEEGGASVGREDEVERGAVVQAHVMLLFRTAHVIHHLSLTTIIYLFIYIAPRVNTSIDFETIIPYSFLNHSSKQSAIRRKMMIRKKIKML